MTSSTEARLQRARRVLDLEMAALAATRDHLGEDFAAVVERVRATLLAGGKLLFSGVGKSAHIAQKLAGTFNSIGAPSCFLDATQALHGDLGLCHEGDLALLLSNSGVSEEMQRLLPLLRRFGVAIVALTSQPTSPLGQAADLRLVYQVPEEACPLRLAPTASSTAALALGDALAMVLLEEWGLTRDDFARFHPAGAIGMSLLLKVDEIMRQGDRLACCDAETSVADGIVRMTKAKSGCLAVVGSDGRIEGIFTDGDFRRCALGGGDFLHEPVGRFMTRRPIVIASGSLAVDALRLFQQARIDDLLVVDVDGRPIGCVDMQDLPKLKVY